VQRALVTADEEAPMRCFCATPTRLRLTSCSARLGLIGPSPVMLERPPNGQPVILREAGPVNC
jgi:hypothetical protein